MWVVRFLRSMPGRVLRVALGLWLIAYGTTHASLLGLVLMMVGIVPAVTGVAGICLLEELLKGMSAHRPQAGDPHERHA